MLQLSLCNYSDGNINYRKENIWSADLEDMQLRS